MQYLAIIAFPMFAGFSRVPARIFIRMENIPVRETGSAASTIAFLSPDQQPDLGHSHDDISPTP